MAESKLWQVVGGVGHGGLLVRCGRALASPQLADRLGTGSLVRELAHDGSRLHYELISGSGPHSGWVSLHLAGRKLLQQVPECQRLEECDHTQVAELDSWSAEELVCTDAFGILRGACQNCECNSWTLHQFSEVCWATAEPRNTCDRQWYESVKQKFGKRSICENCGCPDQGHRNLSNWLDQVKGHVKRMRASGSQSDVFLAMQSRPRLRSLPRRSRLPQAALDWHTFDVALFLLTLGHYRPSLLGKRNPSINLPAAPGLLVSVASPSSEKRHAFHPLLYACFCRQTYQPKELVVVDTGTRPSQFMKQKELEDPRVIYKFFNVDDSRENWPKDSLPSEDDKENCWNIAPRATWSLGLKRNIACHLSSGSVIAHFDDDDLYAPEYLSHMTELLLEACKEVDSGNPSPALATLSSWHVTDVSDQTFRFFDPMTDPLVTKKLRLPMAYGYGFSYVYTRSAWATVRFSDVEWSEDGEFVSQLQAMGAPVRLVQDRPKNALAAHSYHPDSTSGGEFRGSTRMGQPVETPIVFSELLPIVREIACSSRKPAQNCSTEPQLDRELS